MSIVSTCTCPRCGSTLIRTTDPTNEPAGYLNCVDCHVYFVGPGDDPTTSISYFGYHRLDDERDESTE